MYKKIRNELYDLQVDQPNRKEVFQDLMDGIKILEFDDSLFPTELVEELAAEGIDVPETLREEVTEVVEDEQLDTETSIIDQELLGEEAHLQERYEEGLTLLKQNEFYSAKEAFDEVRLEALGDLKQKAQDNYHLAASKLEARTQNLRAAARGFAEKEPDNFAGQAVKWEKVQTENPDDQVAVQELKRISDKREHQKMRVHLQGVEKRLERAVEKKSLPAINKELGSLEAWVAQAAELPGELRTEIEDAREVVLEFRKELRSKLDKSSTHISQEEYRKAYAKAKERVDQGVPQIYDVQGVLGKAGEDVDTKKFFDKARELYLGSLPDLAEQRMDQAKGLVPSSPLEEKEVLQDALALLTDEILTVDDRNSLKPHVKKVEEALEKNQQRVKKYQKADQLIKDSFDVQKTSHQQLTLLHEARATYPAHPDLKNRLKTVQGQLEEELTRDLNDVLSTVDNLVLEDKYDQAITKVLAQQKKVHTVWKDTISETSPLGQALAEAKKKIEAIQSKQHDYDKMTKVLNSVKQDLELYEEKEDKSALASAQEELEKLKNDISASYYNRSEVQRYKDKIARQRSISENWKMGKNFYRSEEWLEAIAALSEIVERGEQEAYPEAESLLNRAQAVDFYQKAKKAHDQEDWKKALNQYRQSLALFEEVGGDCFVNDYYQDCEANLDKLSEITENDRKIEITLDDIRGKLENAERLMSSWAATSITSIPQFVEAWEQLEKIDSLYGKKTVSIDNVKSRLIRLWRAMYFERVKKAFQRETAKEIKGAKTLLDELKEHGLFYGKKYEAIDCQVRSFLLDNAYENFLQSPKARYDKLVENRRKRLALLSPDEQVYGKVEKQLRDALRQQVLEEFSQRVDGTFEDTKDTVQWLREELNRPELYQNQRVVVDFMKIAWEKKRYESVNEFARKLRHRPEQRDKNMARVAIELTRAVENMNKGNFPGGKALITKLREDFSQQGEILNMIDALWEFAKSEQVEGLLAKIDHQVEGEFVLLEKALCLAQAHQIAPQDPRIKTALPGIGSRLEGEIQQRLTAAKRIKINLRSKKDLREAIEALTTRIREMKSLVEAEPMFTTMWSGRFSFQNLRTDVENLDEKLKQWSQIHSEIEGIEKQEEDALKHPIRLWNLSGGWEFAALLDSVQDLEREVKQLNSRSARNHVERKLTTYNQYQKIARELNNEIRVLLGHLQDENFDEALKDLGKIDDYWRITARPKGFAGLENVLFYHYRGLRRDVNTIVAHQKILRQLKQDLRSWRQWQVELSELKQNIENKKRDLGDDFPDAQAYLSLREIIENSSELEEMCKVFEDKSMAKPRSGPHSSRAKTTKNKINEIVCDDVAQMKEFARELNRKANLKLHEGEEQFKRLEKVIGDLQSAKARLGERQGLLRKEIDRIPAPVIQRVERELKHAQEIDKNHRLIDKAKNLLDEVKRINQG